MSDEKLYNGRPMIRSKSELNRMVRRLEVYSGALQVLQTQLEKSGLEPDQIKAVQEPLECFSLQLQEEVDEYRRFEEGNFKSLRSSADIGKMLIALRIAMGWTQSDLAKRTGDNRAQVSRDERNEYQGLALHRLQKILSVFADRFEVRLEIVPSGK